MKHAAAVLASSLTLASLLVACGHSAPEEVESEAVVPVTTEPAQLGSIRATLRATGTVAPAPGAELIVIAPEPARIAEMPKAEGDRVHRGDVLVRFEIPTLTADAESKRAEVGRAAARLATAKAAAARARDLFERGVAARKDVEDADRELADAEAGVAQAQAARASADAISSRTVIHASFDGVVAKRSHNPGDLVEAAASDPVLRVIDPRRLEVSASVPLSEVSQIVLGAPARLIDDRLSQPVSLSVVSRPAAVDPGTAAAPVRLAFAAPARYPAGTPVQVAIDGEEHRGVVLVPSQAIVREGNETAVFVAVNGKAQRRPIEAGLTDEHHVEVRSGLKAGEQVITHGQAGLPDGAPVTVTGK